MNRITEYPDIYGMLQKMPKQLMQYKSATQQIHNSSTTVGNTMI